MYKTDKEGMRYRMGTMKDTIKSAGTFNRIEKGERVRVYDATNLPKDSKFKYFFINSKGIEIPGDDKDIKIDGEGE